jgi:hypothetical protein
MRLFKAHRLSMLLLGGLVSFGLFFALFTQSASAAVSDFTWEIIREGGKEKVIATPKADGAKRRAAEWASMSTASGVTTYGPQTYKFPNDSYKDELNFTTSPSGSFIKVETSNKNVGYIHSNLTTSTKDGVRFGFGNNPATPEPEEDTNDEAEQDSCDVQVNNPLSWIICPVMQLAEGAVNMFATRANDALCFEIAKNNTTSNDCEDTSSPKDQPPKDSETPLYEAWSNIRNIANVLFVVALLAIVISQLVIGKM